MGLYTNDGGLKKQDIPPSLDFDQWANRWRSEIRDNDFNARSVDSIPLSYGRFERCMDGSTASSSVDDDVSEGVIFFNSSTSFICS